MSLAKRCFTPKRGIIIHELLHVLGIMHEHTRPDRDEYIEVHEDNIIPAYYENFKKRSPHLVDTLGLSYDYDSIMHYSADAFALDTSEPTITPYDPKAQIGQRSHISDLDNQKLYKLYQCDIIECPDPGAPEAGSRIGNDFSVGSVVTFQCEEGRMLIGYDESFCRYDGQWSGFQPECMLEPVVVEQCDFEVGMCGWANDLEKGDITWTRQQGSTNHENTGPVLDHTLETSKGHYLLLESAYPRLPGQRGVTVTPTFKPQTEQVCLRIAYYMWGETMGTLNVYARFHNRDDVLLWTMSGNQGPQWKTLDLAFPVTKPVQIAVEGIIGYDYSDMGIDDFLLKDCLKDASFEPVDIVIPEPSEIEKAPLPVEFECNFEDLCVFTDDETSDFKWLLRRGPTSTFRTGPTVDHTLGTEEGHYIYTEASFPRNPGEAARLVSPSIYDPTVLHCLQFYYHMFGDAMGTLIVYLEHGTPSTRSPIWKVSGDLGDLWRKRQITIPKTSTNIKIIFEGIIGNGARSDIALDDISLMTGACLE